MLQADPSQFTIGLICALPVELVAVQEMLDEECEALFSTSEKLENNFYLGRIQNHYVVATLGAKGAHGVSSVTDIARDLARAFRNLRFLLSVGIGGGVPTEQQDIRLGDVVVGAPQAGKGGFLQYDFGKLVGGQPIQLTGQLYQPRVLQRALTAIQIKHLRRHHTIKDQVYQVLERNKDLVDDFAKPPDYTDLLFESTAHHTNICSQDRCTSEISDRLVNRALRCQRKRDPAIHYGLVASSSYPVNDALVRDKLSAHYGSLCFETGAFGLTTDFPCLVIRGISDYADSHKSKTWQGYAAMTAAAYMKELLTFVTPAQVEKEMQLSLSNRTAVTAAIQPIKNSAKSFQKHMSGDYYRRWLNPPDPCSNFSAALENRHPGTGRWLLQDNRYQSWKRDSNSILWLSGNPGSGKTTLCSTLLEDLRANAHHSQKEAVLFFYFDFNDARKQSLDDVVRSLMVQMSEQDVAAEQISWIMKQGHNATSTQALCKTLLGMLKASKSTYLVLDALDECPLRGSCKPRSQILKWIQGLREANISGLHLMVTSRPEQDINTILQGCVPIDYHIQLETELHSADIEAYIEYHMRKDEILSRFYESHLRESDFRSVLSKKANGIFRWIALQIHELHQCQTEAQVRDAFACLPKDLNETYSRMLERLPTRFMHDSIRLLQFLLHSERPLTVTEAFHAIAIDLTNDPPQFDPTRVYEKRDDLLTICSGFVTITGGTAFKDKPRQCRNIQLAHFSVQEYLMSDQLRKGIATPFSRSECHSVIAKACMVYLHHLYSDTQADKLDGGAFKQFCTRYWSKFARLADEDPQMQKLAVRFYLGEDHVYQKALRHFNPDKLYRRHVEGNRSALYHASNAGQFITCKALIQRGEEVNPQEGLFSSPLQVASFKGFEQIVHLLLDSGADINLGGGELGTALQAASSQGYEQIVRLLINRGANVNAQGGCYGSALQAASFQGYEQIARLLLEGGADVNAKGGFYGTALQAASFQGYEQIARLMLEGGADVKAQGGFYGTALQAASSQGYEQIARLILEGGADVNAQGGFYGTALQAASSQGYKQIVRLLLAEQANVNAQGGYHGNALHAASRQGHDQIVQLLLDAGADPSIEGSEFSTILHAASPQGFQSMAQVSMEQGTDLGRSRLGRPALLRATDANQLAIAKLLIQNNDSYVYRDSFGRTILHCATITGNSHLLRMLLSRHQDLDVNAQDDKGATPLHDAAEYGDLQAIRVLLEFGARTDIRDNGNMLPMDNALVTGHLSIVKLLIEKGTFKDYIGRSVLHLAADIGRPGLLRMLLSECRGLNINEQDIYGVTPLHAAAEYGDLETTRVLLEFGASTDMRNNANMSPLRIALEKGHRQLSNEMLGRSRQIHRYEIRKRPRFI